MASDLVLFGRDPVVGKRPAHDLDVRAAIKSSVWIHRQMHRLAMGQRCDVERSSREESVCIWGSLSWCSAIRCDVDATRRSRSPRGHTDGRSQGQRTLTISGRRRRCASQRRVSDLGRYAITPAEDGCCGLAGCLSVAAARVDAVPRAICQLRVARDGRS